MSNSLIVQIIFLLALILILLRKLGLSENKYMDILLENTYDYIIYIITAWIEYFFKCIFIYINHCIDTKFKAINDARQYKFYND